MTWQMPPSVRGHLGAAQFEGRHVRVDWAAQRSVGIRGGGTRVLYEPGRSVFVGNLPFDIQVGPHLSGNAPAQPGHEQLSRSSTAYAP